ncbi:MAG: hypothetical protein [Olavius algarvensis Gamma 1 endosymbiont]|nr:MAG: hypothetical protein [Olavius algarvensis Gamma 1 endosymbiont]
MCRNGVPGTGFILSSCPRPIKLAKSGKRFGRGAKYLPTIAHKWRRTMGRRLRRTARNGIV